MLPGCWVLAARRNFQAQASKFNITGIQSEATTTAATKWPSSGAWTVAEFSTFELGRPCGPAKPKRWNICHSASPTAWPYCCSYGCGFWLNASNVEFPYLCWGIPTRGDYGRAEKWNLKTRKMKNEAWLQKSKMKSENIEINDWELSKNETWTPCFQWLNFNSRFLKNSMIDFWHGQWLISFISYFPFWNFNYNE